ncbi:hypothetical protein COY28_03315, partial [Candidatus Woesearchaeota archaeon CG_4_10_14_0_2_um_filter_57_5]
DRPMSFLRMNSSSSLRRLHTAEVSGSSPGGSISVARKGNAFASRRLHTAAVFGSSAHTPIAPIFRIS